MADFRKAALDAVFTRAQQLATESDEAGGWTLVKEEGTTRQVSKRVDGFSIDMFKLQGIVNGTPKQMVDVLQSLEEADWKAFDTDTAEWRVIEKCDDHRVLWVVTSLPWPLWSRDVCLANATRSVDVDGKQCFAYVMCSVAHKDAEEKTDKFVRAAVPISVYWLEPHGDAQSKLTRIVHLDPAGNIPAMLINQGAVKMFGMIDKINAQFVPKIKK